MYRVPRFKGTITRVRLGIVITTVRNIACSLWCKLLRTYFVAVVECRDSVRYWRLHTLKRRYAMLIYNKITNLSRFTLFVCIYGAARENFRATPSRFHSPFVQTEYPGSDRPVDSWLLGLFLVPRFHFDESFIFAFWTSVLGFLKRLGVGY